MNQCESILRLLQAAGGDWVSLAALQLVSGCQTVNQRISELRRGKHDKIKWRIDKQTIGRGRRTCWRYRLAKGGRLV